MAVVLIEELLLTDNDLQVMVDRLASKQDTVDGIV
jgi:hypothetical protein